MINIGGQRVFANDNKQVGRLVQGRGAKNFYAVSSPAAPPTVPVPGQVVLMTWGQPREEPRPRRLYMAAHSSPALAPGEGKPRRLGCCQITAAVMALLVFYVLVLIGILYATGSVDALTVGEGRSQVKAGQAGENKVRVVNTSVRHRSGIIVSDKHSSRSGGRPESADADEVQFLHSPSSACSPSHPPYVAAFVHSAPSHTQHRDMIRRTWGGVTDVDGSSIRVLFVVGRSPGHQDNLDAEARRYGDIIQADFTDTYRNLTVKHLAGLQWMLTHCGNARYFLKADDDAFVDVFQLVRFMRRTHGDAAPNALVCNVLPAGTPVMREGKWAVTTEEFPSPGYPRFCGGLLYLVGPEPAGRLYRTARADPRPLWVDDAFVTGVVAERAGVDHFYMNLRYTYDEKELEKWSQKASLQPLPYMVGHMDTLSPGWQILAGKLWQKTLKTSQIA